MEFTHSVPLPVAADSIDLADWIVHLTDEEYRACAKAHHAMGVIGGDRRLGLINVEQIAGTMIVQHYYTEVAEGGHVRFVSEASEGFLLRSVPFTMRVWWDMAVLAAGPGGSQLRCAIGYDAPNWVTAAGAVVRRDHFVHEHLIEETGGFARDIARKYAARSGRA